jgi:hypothetical protein
MLKYRVLQYRTLFLMIAFSLQGWLARAETACSSRDFRPALGAIRNQKELSWCYAVSAADLVTQKTGRRVSSADLAVTFIMQSPQDLVTKGRSEIQNFLKQNPNFFADLAYVRKNEDINFDPNEIDGVKGLIDSGGDASFAIFLANAKGSCLEKNLPTDDALILKMLHQAKLEVMKTIDRVPQTPQSDATSAIKNPTSIAIAKRFEKMVDRRCHRSPFKASLIPVRVGELDIDNYIKKYKEDEPGRKILHDKLFREMDEVLDTRRAVEIGYNLYSIAEKPEGQRERDGDHSGIIAGRKMIGGQCHYLLRNTQGPDCDFLPKFAARCSNGHVWITREELEPTLYGLSYLK